MKKIRDSSCYSVKDGVIHGRLYKYKIYWQNIKTAFHYVANDNKKNPRYNNLMVSNIYLN